MAENKLNAQRFLSRLKNLHSSWTKGKRREREQVLLSNVLTFAKAAMRLSCIMCAHHSLSTVHRVGVQAGGVLYVSVCAKSSSFFKKRREREFKKSHGPWCDLAAGCVLYFYIFVPQEGVVFFQARSW